MDMNRIDPIQTFGGLTIVVQDITRKEPRFPDKKWTKRRRRRVIGKHGSWSIYKPASFQMGSKLICHPAIYAELQKQAYNNRSNL